MLPRPSTLTPATKVLLLIGLAVAFVAGYRFGRMILDGMGLP